MLMENDPLPDFEMQFHDGTRIYNYSSRKQLEIRLGPEHRGSADLDSPIVIDLEKVPITVPQDLLPIFKHVQECLRRCMDIEKATRTKDAEEFPIVVKPHRPHVPSGGSGNGSLLPSTIGDINVSVHSEGARGSFVVGESRSFETRLSTGVVPNSRQQQRGLDDPRAVSGPALPPPNTTRTHSSHHEHYADPPRRLDLPRGSHDTSERSGIASTLSSSTLVPARSERNLDRPLDTRNQEPNGDDVQVKFVENVGWCLRVGNGNFRLLFNDGIQINVFLDQHTLLWSDETARTTIR